MLDGRVVTFHKCKEKLEKKNGVKERGAYEGTKVRRRRLKEAERREDWS